MTNQSEPREMKLIHPSYQPSKVELEEDLRVDATFEEPFAVCLKPVRIRCVIAAKRKM